MQTILHFCNNLNNVEGSTLRALVIVCIKEIPYLIFQMTSLKKIYRKRIGNYSFSFFISMKKLLTVLFKYTLSVDINIIWERYTI